MPAGSRRSAVTLTASEGEETRTASERVPAGSAGPAVRVGPGGIRRRASAPSGADASDARQPCISVNPEAGTPSAGTVTLPPPFRYVASVRRTGNAAPPASARHRVIDASSVGGVKLGPGATIASSGTRAAA